MKTYFLEIPLTSIFTPQSLRAVGVLWWVNPLAVWISILNVKIFQYWSISVGLYCLQNSSNPGYGKHFCSSISTTTYTLSRYRRYCQYNPCLVKRPCLWITIRCPYATLRVSGKPSTTLQVLHSNRSHSTTHNFPGLWGTGVSDTIFDYCSGFVFFYPRLVVLL